MMCGGLQRFSLTQAAPMLRQCTMKCMHHVARLPLNRCVSQPVRIKLVVRGPGLATRAAAAPTMTALESLPVQAFIDRLNEDYEKVWPLVDQHI